MRRLPRFLFPLAAVMLMLVVAGCTAPPQAELDALFPPDVGDFSRTSGPGPDVNTGVDVALYESADGVVRLYIKQVPEGQTDAALAELPANATDVGQDEALGQRRGAFFTFADGFHAAWGNGDWVFVLSADTDYARRAFLAAYSY